MKIRIFCITRNGRIVTDEGVAHITKTISANIGENIDADVEMGANLNIPIILLRRLKKLSDDKIICLINKDQIKYIGCTDELIECLSSSAISNSYDLINEYYDLKKGE